MSRTTNFPLFALLVLLSLITVWASNAASIASEDGRIRVRAVRGSVTCSDDGSNWRPLRVGAALTEGVMIRTGAESSVDLFVPQNAGIRLFPGTTLEFVKLGSQSTGAETIVTTLLNLQRGQIAANVKKLASQSTYLVKTKSATASVRGTDYVTCENGKTWVLVGEVSIDCGSHKYTVKGGECFDAGNRMVAPFKNPLPRSAERFLNTADGYSMYLIGESFRRMQDGWPPFPVRAIDYTICRHTDVFDAFDLNQFKCE